MEEIINKIEDLLHESNDIMWTIAYIPDIKTYSIRIGKLEPEDDNHEIRSCSNCLHGVVSLDPNCDECEGQSKWMPADE